MHRSTNLAIGSTQMQLLLVADSQEDFTCLRDLLIRTGEGNIGLDHAHSLEEVFPRLKQTTYDLILCDYKSGDGVALRLLRDLRKDGVGAPVIFLSDHVDEKAVEAAIRAGAGHCVQTPGLD
jgi:DNA-binding NarL/FixJ family response regulator